MWLAGSPLAIAQPTSLPASVLTPSTDNSVLRNQLTLARKLERQALEGIRALPGDDSAPIDPISLQAARDAYVLMRVVRHGMTWQMERRKFPDPIQDLVFKRVEDAWNLSRTPVDRATWATERAEYVRISVRDMSQALRLLDQALALMQ